MNLILENIPDIPFYTDMNALFDVLGWACCREHDWLISDVEGFVCHNAHDVLPNPLWITGSALEKLLRDNPHQQFIWAVFSAFKPNTLIDNTIIPFADSDHFWQDTPLKPQHPQAEFEIVAFDSSLTLLIGLPDKWATNVIQRYPECKVLLPSY